MQHKTTIITILLFLISINLHAQSNQIFLTAKNAPIKEVLAEIQTKSGYRILYNDEVVSDDLRVSVNAENTSVKDVLNIILMNTDLTCIMQSEELIIITKQQYVSERNEIFGTVTDENGAPVPYANVVLLQPADTTRLGYGAVTDEQGYYRLANVKPASYRLQVSFIGYKTQYAEFVVSGDNSQPIVQNFTLPTDQTLLQELVVLGERPALKAENGKLIYHLPSLLKNKSATNAYEALKEIPGVMEQDERLTLIGTSGMTLLLNGKKTTMTTEQLMNLLRSLPLSRVENVEIMYSTPPQYNIRGAAINVMLRQQGDDVENVWQGEMAGTLSQRTYAVGSGRSNMLYIGKKTTFDALYSYGNYRTKNTEMMNAEHKLHDNTYIIKQENEGTTYYQSHNIRLALSHTFNNKDNAEISYLGTFDKSRSERTALNDIDNKKIKSQMGQNGPSGLHNFKADYGFHFGLKLGAEHTIYDDKTTYHFFNTENNPNDVTDKINSNSRQQINRSFFYANQTHTLKNNWTINYGGNYSLANTRNFSDAVRNDTVYNSASFNNTQKENIWNAFAGFTKSFSKQFSLQASLAVENYKADETSKGKKTQLWDNWALFPTVNATYNVSPTHIFQFALSADKMYPSYWSLNPTVYHFNAYGITYGNPHLKPMRIYDVSLTYIHKQKYVIRPYLNHISDYFVQLPYQSPDKLQQEYMEQNYNYKQEIGLIGVLPFNIGKRISSRLTLNGMYWREKDDEFFTLSFDRKTFFGVVQLNTDINLSEEPNLKMNISGYSTTPTAIQGIFDLGASRNLSTGITYSFDKERAKLILKADDIFNTRTPVAAIDYREQKSNQVTFRDTRSISLSFVYRFGGYKEKERKEVDTSRFGTN
jgi:hypothetical protein